MHGGVGLSWPAIARRLGDLTGRRGGAASLRGMTAWLQHPHPVGVIADRPRASARCRAGVDNISKRCGTVY